MSRASRSVGRPQQREHRGDPGAGEPGLAVLTHVLEEEVAEHHLLDPGVAGDGEGAGHRGLVDVVRARRRDVDDVDGNVEARGLRGEELPAHRVHGDAIGIGVHGDEEGGDVEVELGAGDVQRHRAVLAAAPAHPRRGPPPRQDARLAAGEFDGVAPRMATLVGDATRERGVQWVCNGSCSGMDGTEGAARAGLLGHASSAAAVGAIVLVVHVIARHVDDRAHGVTAPTPTTSSSGHGRSPYAAVDAAAAGRLGGVRRRARVRRWTADRAAARRRIARPISGRDRRYAPHRPARRDRWVAPRIGRAHHRPDSGRRRAARTAPHTAYGRPHRGLDGQPTVWGAPRSSLRRLLAA